MIHDCGSGSCLWYLHQVAVHVYFSLCVDRFDDPCLLHQSFLAVHRRLRCPRCLSIAPVEVSAQPYAPTTNERVRPTQQRWQRGPSKQYQHAAPCRADTHAHDTVGCGSNGIEKSAVVAWHQKRRARQVVCRWPRRQLMRALYNYRQGACKGRQRHHQR